MKIYIGADHRGYKDKELISNYLKGLGHEVIDDGDDRLNPEDDFPNYASKVVKNILASPKDSKGILLCGSGQGMSIAANRFKGIRASLCWDDNEAFSARHDDDSNVLCLSADKMAWADMEKILTTWLTTPFANDPKYVRRIKELDTLN